jgi:hypothetical protein
MNYGKKLLGGALLGALVVSQGEELRSRKREWNFQEDLSSCNYVKAIDCLDERNKAKDLFRICDVEDAGTRNILSVDLVLKADKNETEYESIKKECNVTEASKNLYIPIDKEITRLGTHDAHRINCYYMAGEKERLSPFYGYQNDRCGQGKTEDSSSKGDRSSAVSKRLERTAGIVAAATIALTNI